jgi:hypothetical protein
MQSSGTSGIYSVIKNLSKKDLEKEKKAITTQHINALSDIRCFNLKYEEKILPALEIKNLIHLAIKKSNEITLEKILTVIDDIQRAMNNGIEPENVLKDTLDSIQNGFGDQFYNSVVLLAKHQNHFIGSASTKINWFGFVNRTSSIMHLKEILRQNPQNISEPYEDGFFQAAQVQNLDRESQLHLRCAMSLLKSNGIFGAPEYKCRYQETNENTPIGFSYITASTENENSGILKSARYRSCQVELCAGGILNIKFYKPRYILMLNGTAAEEENTKLARNVQFKISKNGKIIFYKEKSPYDTPRVVSSNSMSSSSLASLSPTRFS